MPPLTASRTASTAETLLAELAGIRRLARRLARDDHHAEELVQDTCLLALTRPPDRTAPLSGWLGTVLRNLLRQQHRSALRRARYEQRAPVPAHAPATDRLAEQRWQQEELAHALALVSPRSREVIRMRFFENLPPRAIAEALQVPVSTVNTRLVRGIQALRQQLQPRPPARRPLGVLVLLRGLWQRPRGAPRAARAAALVALAAGGWWLPSWNLPTARERLPGAHPTGAAQRSAPSHVSLAPPVPERNAARRAPVAANRGFDGLAAFPRFPVDAPGVLRGRALWSDGRPAAGIHVGLLRDGLPGEGVAHHVPTDADGWYELPDATWNAPEGALPVVREVRVQQSGHTTLFAAVHDPDSSRTPTLLAATSRDVRGRVVTAAGQALAGAWITWQAPADLEARLAVPLDSSRRGAWQVQSARDGAFHLGGVPDVPAAQLVVQPLAGAAWSEPLRVGGDGDLTLTAPAARGDQILCGEVVDALGRGVGGALLERSGHVTTSRADGSFELPARDASGSILRVVAAGHQPLRWLLRPADEHSPLRLTLGPPSLSLRGQLVDADGRARAGVRVWLRDPELLGALHERPVVVEHVMAGFAPEPPPLVAGESAALDTLRVQTSVARSDPTMGWAWGETDADGRFQLDGLQDRAYVLSALDLASLEVIESEPIDAGSEDMRWTFPAAADGARERGQVVDENGRPVPRARVQLLHAPARGEILGTSGRWLFQPQLLGPAVATDSFGRFELPAFHGPGWSLRIHHPDHLPLEMDAAALRAAEEPLVLPRRSFLQVASDPLRATDRVEVRSSAGQLLAPFRLHHGEIDCSDGLALPGGGSGVVAVAPSVLTLHLIRGGVEVACQRVETQPGEVLPVDFRSREPMR